MAKIGLAIFDSSNYQ